VLLAKGSDFLALKIREIAVANNVMLLESPGLARSIYYSTELEQEIPGGLYLAVAWVLAYVYQIRQYRAGKGKRPDPLKDDLPIPAGSARFLTSLQKPPPRFDEAAVFLCLTQSIFGSCRRHCGEGIHP
jgi:type III secretion system FlhB-like substrate exporter